MPEALWKDPRCIICGEEKSLTEKAHVISKSLGGNLYAFNECGDCNHGLGSRIEKAIRSNPEIRCAASNLRANIPELERRINAGPGYIAVQDDGSVLRFVRHVDRFELRNWSEPGSFILDDKSGLKSIRSRLVRDGHDQESADSVIDNLMAAPPGTVVRIDDENAARRGSVSHDRIAHGFEEQPFDDQAAVLMESSRLKWCNSSSGSSRGL